MNQKISKEIILEAMNRLGQAATAVLAVGVIAERLWNGGCKCEPVEKKLDAAVAEFDQTQAKFDAILDVLQKQPGFQERFDGLK